MNRGSLYVVSTPIGNLEDITYRAVRILSEVDIVACEDTRRTSILLNHYGIRKKLVSFNEENKNYRTEKLILYMSESKSVALVSDAGTPVVSDPGYSLVRRCSEEGIRIIPVPGPSSVTAALCVSGFRAEEFMFFGFLPRKKSKREKKILAISESSVPSVIFESPMRISKTLDEIAQRFPEREIFIAREMTKINEELLLGKPWDIAQKFSNHVVKGEIVLVIGGK
ncbi:16S rRNA (cytidine(1402)-2'-O)-methyltransferase [candidate division WOR-3 bacterium]|nr:16S rRNA (cytidine(1402)-2'-O)-methyltransferase [candidate division WOR-3 bacterium]